MWALDLAFKNIDLVAKDQQFEEFFAIREADDRRDIEQPGTDYRRSPEEHMLLALNTVVAS